MRWGGGEGEMGRRGGEMGRVRWGGGEGEMGEEGGGRGG